MTVYYRGDRDELRMETVFSLTPIAHDVGHYAVQFLACGLQARHPSLVLVSNESQGQPTYAMGNYR